MTRGHGLIMIGRGRRQRSVWDEVAFIAGGSNTGEHGAGMGAGKKEVVVGMGGGTGARVEGYMAMGEGFINKYSKLNENVINEILSLSLYY